jgi:hypothetical protein
MPSGTWGADPHGGADVLDNTLVALRIGIVDAHDSRGRETRGLLACRSERDAGLAGRAASSSRSRW